MSGRRLPAPAGRWIDRSRPLTFTFDGRRIDGFAGDTLASALLAAGIVHVGRSFKLHRPRGIFSCGIEEPTGIVDIGSGALRTPVTRLTDVAASDGLVAVPGNAWPTLAFDLAALASAAAPLLPAGFYYKTFKWPDWHLFEPAIRRMAGLGHAAAARDPDRYDEVSVSVDTVVVGGGCAGVAAALAAAGASRAVLLVEADPRFDDDRAAESLRDAGVRVLLSTCAFGVYDHGLVCALQTAGAAGARERLWKLQAGHLVVATGAYERPMLFPDNDRPGVMLASSMLRYAERYGVACGRRVVVATACDDGWRTAQALRAACVDVVAVVDLREQGGGTTVEGSAAYRGHAIVAVEGTRAVRAVAIAPVGGGPTTRIACDCIASAGGWTPAVHLWSMSGGRLRYDERMAMFVPTGSVAGLGIVGAAAGELGNGVEVVAADNSPSDVALASWPSRGGPAKIFIDLQNDVTTADVALAARESYRSVEHLKRYTTLGMASDQGKTSNVNGLIALGVATGRSPDQVGTTKFRPPVKPVTLNAIAGGRSGERHRPLKRMPAHGWHADRGAAFEEFSGWLRPAAYPRAGESLVGAAEREAAHVRAHVGIFDQSPLGKIEVIGPDAASFLDFMYVGTMSTLAVGSARYGLLLNEMGVIVDDGIVARLGESRFWINTTSGAADRIALAFEEWLQCEHVSLRVAVVAATSNWGNVTVAGPEAWSLLKRAGFDASFAPETMAHMTMREGCYAGTDVRVLRASFSGELGYEINLPALRTAALLCRLEHAGRELNVQPYGVEAVMVLRIEKGYLHVGSDTDGTTLPGDVGMQRAVEKKKSDFVGRRSLALPAALDRDRMQLVGLVPLERSTRLPVGAHIAAHRPPAEIDGFVTSSAWSPALGHPIALAMLRRGASRNGERVVAWHLGRPVEARVTKPPFVDPQGKRLRG